MSIRNFCIIAHIDHGKSTLADRLMQVTGTVAARDQKEQLLDTMDLERERGITIKLQPVRMAHAGLQLNLIDTPGHADFSYEVSRTLAAVEGALVVVDASQGIEAQTLATVYAALEHNLPLIPVINKIDLPAADPDRIAEEIERTLSVPASETLRVSAKEGIGISEVLDAIATRIPEAKRSSSEESKALIFDSLFDAYRGVVVYVRVVSGTFKKGDTITLLGSGRQLDILEVGSFRPSYKEEPALTAGEIGYVVTGLKSVREARVGETLWQGPRTATPMALPGYRKVTPFRVCGSVFCRCR